MSDAIWVHMLDRTRADAKNIRERILRLGDL
jgi:hypothetical protein